MAAGEADLTPPELGRAEASTMAADIRREASKDTEAAAMATPIAAQEYHPQTVRSYSDDAWRARGGYDADRYRDTAGVSRDRLDKFLGLPTDAGLGAVSSAGVEGTRVTAGRVEGPYGGSAAFVSGTHVNYVPSSVRSAQALSVRQNFYGHDWFNSEWFRTHPDAWAAEGIAASAWAPATWYGVADWLGCDTIPQDYDYGSTVLYQGDNVYVEGQPVGSPTQYFDQATSLASSRGSSARGQGPVDAVGCFRAGAGRSDQSNNDIPVGGRPTGGYTGQLYEHPDADHPSSPRGR